MSLKDIPLIVVSHRLGHAKPSVALDLNDRYPPGMQKEGQR